jgi:formate hydrogenlyase subunit 4
MTGELLATAVLQVVGGLLGGPLVVGLTQTTKARLQGRRGASPVQPYRDLARLWRKSVVDVAGTTWLYRTAPALVAASSAVLVLLVPLAGRSTELGVGRDVLVLAGLLALARFAVTLAAFDTSNGFALMGASRDLMFAVFVEGALIVAIATAALLAGSTDLAVIERFTAGTAPWSLPSLGLAAAGFALVVVAETGRQPVDNPDTHLELTMIHEGPLLEYAGRDLAYLQWVAGVRHWIVLVLAAEVFLPHPADPALALLLLPLVVAMLCVALALVESLVVKLRILLVPRLLGIATVLGLLAVLSHIVERVG